MKKAGSIMEMRGCLPRLDHVLSLDEKDKAIGEAIMADWERFECESHGKSLPRDEEKTDI